jgi:hypothetical protein
MLVRQTQLGLNALDFLNVAGVLHLSHDSALYAGCPRLTLPLSSDSLTQLFPLILFSLITILSGFDTSSGFDAF